MKNTFAKIILITMIFLVVFPFNITFAGSTESSTPQSSTEKLNTKLEAMDDDEKEKLKTDNPFQQVMSEFGLSVGDYAHDYLSQVLKEEVTIDKIVYNEVDFLNANFFDTSTNPANSSASVIVKKAINTWFSYFQRITLMVAMVSLVVAGIKIILGTPNSKVKAMEILKKFVMAIALVYLFPFVMRGAFQINEAIIKQIAKETRVNNTAVGVSISQVSDLLIDELEERSPQYVSLTGLRVGAGSTEATELYLNKLERYASSADIMRIMRAFAGVTLRFVYVIIWYILLTQTYILVVIYIKRYIVIAFLIAVYPLVIIGYITDSLQGEKHNAFNTWCNKFFANVFLQTLHAIIYGVISGIVVSQVRDALVKSIDDLNWILMVIAVSFLFTGEKVLTRFWKAAVDTADRKGMRDLLKMPGNMLGKLLGK